MKKKRGILAALILSVAMGCMGLSGAASAGTVDVTLLEEDFAGTELDPAAWYSRSSTGVSLEQDYIALRVKDGYTGTGVATKAKLSGGAAVEIDVKELDWADTNGSFRIAFGLPTNTGNFHNAYWEDGKADGIYLTFNKDCSDHAIRLAGLKSSLSGLVDGQGNTLATPTPYAFTDVKALADPASPDKIRDKTLRVEYGEDGSFTLSARPFGESGDFTVIARTTGSKLRAFPEGYISVHCMESAKGFPFIDIRDIRVYDKDGGAVAAFGENVGKDYLTFRHSFTGSMSAGAKNALTFGEKYGNANPLFMSKRIVASDPKDSVESLAQISFGFTAKKWQGNKKFGLLLGAEKQSSGNVGQAGTSFFYLTKSTEGWQYGMDAYAQADVPTAVIPEQSLPKGVLPNDLNISLTLGSKGTLEVKFNGESAYSANDAAYAYDGYAGFAMTGDETSAECGVLVTIGSFLAENSYYDRPENANVQTDFAGDSYNTNLWNMRSESYMQDFLNGMYVREGGLVFDNVAMNSYISTKFQYSNFELKYSVTDLRREVVTDPATGAKLYPVSSWIGAMFGAAFPQDEFGRMESSVPLIYLEAPVDANTWDRQRQGTGYAPTQLVVLNVGRSFITPLPSKYDFWDPSKEGLTLDIRIRVTDRRLTVGLKYRQEEEYTDFVDEEMPRGLTGYLYLCGMGNNYYLAPHSVGASCGHFTLDDIKITNLDEGANLTEVSFASNRPDKVPGDYPYVDKNDDADYLTGGGSGCGKGDAASASLCAALLCAAFVIGRRG